jgi:hypothetical protein
MKLERRLALVSNNNQQDAASASNYSASCAMVRSPSTAASATFALKAGVWFRRGRLDMLSPDSQAQRACRQAENSN